ncbi:hypothetical protein WN51_14649 [Melipona quadrifasciata]|uniref:Uncharacterized protein n=1 Tax=Melipona quadrifasciata TaxID=166423 RepID=A0A0N0BFC7_9HYME|nr:hypothetical protein WN51_14649 [Melipona quadrifasciata]
MTSPTKDKEITKLSILIAAAYINFTFTISPDKNVPIKLDRCRAPGPRVAELVWVIPAKSSSNALGTTTKKRDTCPPLTPQISRAGKVPLFPSHRTNFSPLSHYRAGVLFKPNTVNRTKPSDLLFIFNLPPVLLLDSPKIQTFTKESNVSETRGETRPERRQSKKVTVHFERPRIPQTRVSNTRLAQAASGCAPSVDVLPIFDVKQQSVRNPARMRTSLELASPNKNLQSPQLSILAVRTEETKLNRSVKVSSCETSGAGGSIVIANSKF